MMVADRIIGPLRSMDRQKRTMIGAGLALAIATAGVGYWAGSSGLFTENGSSAGAQGETVDGVVQDGSGQRVLYWYDPMIPMERYDAPGKSFDEHGAHPQICGWGHRRRGESVAGDGAEPWRAYRRGSGARSRADCARRGSGADR